MPSTHSKGAGIKKTLLSWLFHKKASFSFLAIMSLSIVPALAYTEASGEEEETVGSFYTSPSSNLYNSQTIDLLTPKWTTREEGPVGGREDIRTEGAALVADVNPIADVEIEKIVSASSDDISIYLVREGDTIGEVAEMFGVSANTIRWANNIEVKGGIKPGQELIILPISGIKYKVAKGDTFASIAKKYKADAHEISLFNGIEESEVLVVGSEIIIPNGEAAETPASKKTASKVKGLPSKEVPSGYYIRPVKGVKTQGQHDRYKAIDIGAPTGTPIWAMADGKVIVTKPVTAWNGGYGGLVIIEHDNGTQTLYAHLSSISVKMGQMVSQGEIIGGVGSTGRSTGPHLHVEIRTGNTGISGINILEKMY